MIFASVPVAAGADDLTKTFGAMKPFQLSEVQDDSEKETTPKHYFQLHKPLRAYSLRSQDHAGRNASSIGVPRW